MTTTLKPTPNPELVPMSPRFDMEDDEPGGFESIGRSAMGHPFLIALITVLGLVAGSAVGYLHPVTYTAQAQLLVGRTSGLAEQEVPGLATAVQGLASDYARLATTSAVTKDTESILGTATLPGTIVATPVPESSVIDVDGQASTEAGSVALANAAAAALVKVVTTATNDTQAQLSSLMSDYKSSEHQSLLDTANASLLQSELNNLSGSIGNNPATPAQVQREDLLKSEIAADQTAASAASLQAQAYSSQYTAAVPPLQIQQEMVQQVGNASYTGSNRKSYLEAAGLLGFVGGLVIGLALAAFIDMRRQRLVRRYRQQLATPQL